MSVTKARLKKALIAADGNMAVAAKALEITRQTVQERVRRDPKLSDLIDRLRNGDDEELRDLSTSNVAKAIRAGDVKISRWYLERRDPTFRQNVSLRISDAEIDAFVNGVAASGGQAALRKLAEGG